MIIGEHLSARLVIVQRCQEREGGSGRKWEEVGGTKVEVQGKKGAACGISFG